MLHHLEGGPFTRYDGRRTLSQSHTPMASGDSRPTENQSGLSEQGPTVQSLLSLYVPKQTKIPIFPAPPPELFSFTNHFGKLR